MKEFNELQMQMKELKESLKAAPIINKENLHKIIEKETRWMSKTFRQEVISLPFLLLIILATVLMSKMSIWVFITCCIGIAIDVYMDYRTMLISRNDIETLDLVSLRKKIEKQKKERFWQFVIAIPFCLAWAVWFFYGFFNWLFDFQLMFNQMAIIITIIAFIIFAVLTTSVCIKLYKKMGATNNEILEEIENYR